MFSSNRTVEPFPGGLIRGLQIGSMVIVLLTIVAVVSVHIPYRPDVNYAITYLIGFLAIMASIVTYFIPRQLIEKNQAQSRLLQEMGVRLAQLEALHRISSIAAGPINLEESLQRILVAVRSVRPFASASLFVLDESENVLRILASQDIPAEAMETSSFKVGEGIIGWAVANNQPIVVEDTLKDPRYKPASHGEEKSRSLLAVPLSARGKVIAAVALSHLQIGAFSEEDLRLVEMMASHASQIIENARLMEEASEARALRRLDALKTEFLTTVSHELRTPLTVIKGAVELLLELVEQDPDPVKRRLLVNISMHQQRLSRLVVDLLDMAQIEVGRMQLVRQMVDIQALIRETVASMRLIADNQGHSIRIDTTPRLIEVYADRHRVQQILTNLLGNAIQHTPEGTSIRISAVDEAECAAVTVSDDGQGIPEAILEHVFEKFYHYGTKNEKGGTGLGLAIAGSLVELHGGKITVKSALGAGTAFTFTLPKEIVEE